MLCARKSKSNLGSGWEKLAADARAETNAAVVETLAASQADLGVAAPVARKPVAPEMLSAGLRIAVKGFQAAGDFSAARWPQGGRLRQGRCGCGFRSSDVLAIADDVTAAKSGADATGRRSGVTVHAQPSDEPAGEEINVIGCTVEEATRRVDKFIDEAALAGKPSVRIIHGHGMGALRRGLAEFLSAHPLVERIRHEAADRGGEAITIAELKWTWKIARRLRRELGEKKISDFTDLDMWKHAHRLRQEIYRVAGDFRSQEKYGLSSQIETSRLFRYCESGRRLRSLLLSGKRTILPAEPRLSL